MSWARTDGCKGHPVFLKGSATNIVLRLGVFALIILIEQVLEQVESTLVTRFFGS